MSRAAHDDGSLPPALSEDEISFRASMGHLVDWYRVRQSGVLLRAFLPGALVLLPLGSVMVALSLANLGWPEPLRPLLTVAGVLVTASGPLWALFQLLRAIRGDLYVAIRLEGLGLRLDPREEEVVYDWERIEDVRYADAALHLEIASTSPVRITGAFAELSLEELGRRIRDARRLGVWHRLSPRYPQLAGRE